jgi:hypothetical protein
MVIQRTRDTRGAGRGGQTLLVAAVLLVTGCGQPATEISGVVSLDGQPVPNASLEFFPISGKGRVSFTRTDAKGNFRVAVSPTKLRVVITATKVDGTEKNLYGAEGPPLDRLVSILPQKYGHQEQTPLTADPVEGKTTTIDFALSFSKK